MLMHSRTFFCPVVFSLGFCLLVLDAQAKDLSVDELFNMPLEELLNIKITGATLTDKNLRTVPSSVTVFTRQQIQSLSVDTLEELLNYVPGFQSFRQGDGGNEYYHSSRGRRTGTSSREVLILVDGQRFLGEFAEGASAPMVALGNIEKIEVIRGPGSAIYGSNAFLGVINITTVKNRNEALLSYGSNNNMQGQVLASGQLNEVDVNVYAHVFNDNGESYRLENSATHTPYTSADPNKGDDFNVKIGSEKTQFNLMHFERQANEFYVVENSSNQYNEIRNQYSSARFQQTLDWHSAIDTHYSLRYSEADIFEQTPLLPPKANADFKEQEYEFDIYNNWTINAQHGMQFGLEQRHVKTEQVNLNTVGGPLLLSDASSRDISGLYVQNQNSLTDNTELTLGARYDRYSQVGSALSPRVGLIHQLSDVQTVKLLYGQAFRAPSIGELAFTPVSAVRGNPDLKPETIETWELVWMGTWQNHSLTITGFDNCIDDAIVQGFVGSNRIYVNSNNTERSQGVEIEYMTQLAVEWQLYTTYSLFNTLPDSAFRQADELASAIINYHKNQWNLNFSATYNDQREMVVGSTQQSLSGYWLLNSKWQYAFSGDWSAFLQAKNILNEDYLTPTQGTTLTQGIPNRGREIEVGVHWIY